MSRAPSQAQPGINPDLDAGLIGWLRPERKASPERRPRRFKPAAEPHRADAPREPGRIVGLDRDRAQRCLAQSRLEPARSGTTHEPVHALLLRHADERIAVTAPPY